MTRVHERMESRSGARAARLALSLAALLVAWLPPGGAIAGDQKPPATLRDAGLAFEAEVRRFWSTLGRRPRSSTPARE